MMRSALSLETYGLTPGVYVYARGLPVECHGYSYRLHRSVKAIPSYQDMVLVEALDGPDVGLWFVVSVSNFARRYDPIPPEENPCP